MRNAAILASALVCALVVQVNLENSLAKHRIPNNESSVKFQKHILESFNDYKLSSYQEDAKNKEIFVFSPGKEFFQSGKIASDSLSRLKLKR